MDGLEGKTLLKWMIWGYHHFRKHPYRGLYYITQLKGEYNRPLLGSLLNNQYMCLVYLPPNLGDVGESYR